MQRAPQVQMAHLLDVLSVVIHHEELEVRKRVVLVGQETVAA